MEIEIGGKTVEYSVSNTIERNHEAFARAERPDAPDWMKPPPRRLERDKDVYPKTGTYEFGEFAGPVFELGGYGDMTMVDPYTLERLWVAHVFNGEDTSLFEAMRRVIDVAEAIGFPGHEHALTGPAGCQRCNSMREVERVAAEDRQA
jgi:hypothetical protein